MDPVGFEPLSFLAREECYRYITGPIFILADNTRQCQLDLAGHREQHRSTVPKCPSGRAAREGLFLQRLP